MNASSEYQKKCVSPEDAVSILPKTSVISMGMRVATPPALLKALEKRIRANEIDELKAYYMRCGDVALETIFQEDLMDKVRPYSSMMTRGEIKLALKGFNEGKKNINYVPITFSRYAEFIKRHTELDAFLVMVSPMDKFGYFNLGLNGDYAIELARYAKKLIVEVNEHLPRTAGQTMLHISEVDFIVENTTPLLEEPSRPILDVDKAIGRFVAPLIPDGATIQMGIGGVPNAVCEELKDRQDLGIHTEVFTSGMMDLIKRGVVTNKKKTLHRHASVFTFAIGTREVYDFIDNNPSMLCFPASYTNEPNVVGQNNSMISVNAFVEIDLFGQVNAEVIGGHQFSGVGGQLDFVRGVKYSKGGKTILASSSTAGHGKFSRIVPRLASIVTDTRLDVDYVITEYGICQLIGKSTTERAEALIGIAHPDFRGGLIEAAKKQSILPRGAVL